MKYDKLLQQVDGVVDRGWSPSVDLVEKLGKVVRSLRTSFTKIKKQAEAELERYEESLKDLYTDRCMSLAQGMLAGFCVVGLLTKKEGENWLERLQRHRRLHLQRLK
jgi:hypothetical protein